jgi:hypothetical protein
MVVVVGPDYEHDRLLDKKQECQMPDEETFSRDRRTEEFLDVEQAAREIAMRLKRLDEEANRYSAAASNLDNSAAAAKELVSAVREIGVSAEKALEAIASVGGPEIIAKLERIEKERLVEVSDRIDSLKATFNHDLDSLAKKVNATLLLSVLGFALLFSLHFFLPA